MIMHKQAVKLGIGLNIRDVFNTRPLVLGPMVMKIRK
jgi:hypothetical protein